MSKRVLVCTVMCILLTSLAAKAQQVILNQCPYAQQHWNQLACLVPDLAETGGTTHFGTFSTALAEVVGQLPLAAPTTGFGLTLDKTLGVYVIPNESLGAILSERGDTVGKYHLFVGFTFQKFNFQTIDGTQLDNLPISYTTTGRALGFSQSSVAANINQYTGVAAFGLTSRIDVSVTVPFERVSLGAGHGNIYEGLYSKCVTPPGYPTGCPQYVSGPQYVPGAASGFGDVVVEGKGTVWKGEHFRLAAGFDVRFPTGNEYNLLGSGAYGYKPFLTFSRHGRFTPHVNAGYQWNGHSALYLSCPTQQTCVNQELPRWVEYSAGADVAVVKRLTVVADLLGQHFFNAPRITPAALCGAGDSQCPSPYSIPDPSNPTSATGLPVSSIGVKNGDYDADNLAIGLKANVWKNLLFSGNILFKLNDGGLRSVRTPLLGLSYRF